MLRTSFFVTICLLCLMQANAVSGAEQVKVLETAEEYVVPDGKIWRIDGLESSTAPSGVGTANFAFDGNISVNEGQIYLEGQFDFTIGRDVKSITAYSRTRVQVLDTQGSASIVETDAPKAE